MTSNPDTPGGVETIVKNIKEHHDVRYLNTSGPFALIRGLILALILSFSDYDLICSHDNASYMYARLPRFLRRKKLLACHYGSTNYYFKIMPPKSLPERISARIYLHLQKFILERADKVATMSVWIRDEFKKLYGVDSDVIRLGVDTAKFRPLRIKKKYDLIWVGTNPGLRGLSSAIEYAKSHGKKLVVVGLEGKDTPSVTYTGKIRNEDMPRIFNEAKAIIYFSKYKGCPLVVLEAMACGLSVISNRKNLDDIKFSGHGPFFFIDGDQGRKIAAAYDWKNVIRNYNFIYRQLVK